MQTDKQDISQSFTSRRSEYRKQAVFFFGREIARHDAAHTRQLHSLAGIRLHEAALDRKRKDARKQLNLTIHAGRSAQFAAPVEGFAAFFAELLDVESCDLAHLLIPEKSDDWFRTGNVVAPRAFFV